MECKCGGTTFERSHTRQKNNILLAKLTYDMCIACGNSGNFVLWIEGCAVTAGDEARDEFEMYLL
jgi:hypothetical protein